MLILTTGLIEQWLKQDIKLAPSQHSLLLTKTEMKKVDILVQILKK